MTVFVTVLAVVARVRVPIVGQTRYVMTEQEALTDSHWDRCDCSVDNDGRSQDIGHRYFRSTLLGEERSAENLCRSVI